MKQTFNIVKLVLCLGATGSLQPVSSWACAACYGQSDAPMAQGMNWGIMSLLGIIAVVLGGVAGFFVFLARRAAAASKTAAQPASVGLHTQAAPTFSGAQSLVPAQPQIS